MRPGEKDGVDYYFVTKERFLKMKAEGRFVETTEYNGNYYGSTLSEIADDKAIIVDPSGLEAFRKLGNKRIVTFFFYAEEECRRARMALRGDSPEAIEKRIATDRVVFDKKKIGPVDFEIDTTHMDVEEVAATVLRLYQERLKSL